MLSKTYEQLQQIRSYYGFPATLDIDRYTIDGKTQDYVVAARELDLNGARRQPAQLDQRTPELHARQGLRGGAGEHNR